MIVHSELSVLSLFIRLHHSPAHSPSATPVARSHASAHLRGRRKQALAPTVAGTMAGYRFWCFAVFLSGAPLTTVLLSDARAGDEPTLPASRSSRATSVESIAPFITEASRRSAIPAQWIRGVMQLESSGNGRAISPKGAVGLMQIMPGTWVELSVRYGLGIHPFDIRTTTSWLALRTSVKCTIVADRQAFLRPTMPVRCDMNSTSLQESRFHPKGRPTSRRSHHCWTTSRANMPQLTAGVHFHGGRLPCLLGGRVHRDGHSVCIRNAST